MGISRQGKDYKATSDEKGNMNSVDSQKGRSLAYFRKTVGKKKDKQYLIVPYNIVLL